MKLHLIRATDGVPLSYELTPANVAEVTHTEDLLKENSRISVALMAQVG